jgi:hypothetical protein
VTARDLKIIGQGLVVAFEVKIIQIGIGNNCLRIGFKRFDQYFQVTWVQHIIVRHYHKKLRVHTAEKLVDISDPTEVLRVAGDPEAWIQL